MRKSGPPALLILLFLLFSCSDENSVFQEKETQASEAVSILTLDNGTLIENGGNVPVSLTFSDQYMKKKGTASSLSLEAVLKTPDGTQVAALSFASVKTVNGALPSIALPSLQAGYYQLVLTLKESGSVVSEKTLSFFSDSGSYKITRFSSYPLSFLPGSSGILKVFTKYPEGKDPYIRWTLDGKVAQEALASNGGSVYSWTAPVKEGVYSVKVELFPYAPSVKAAGSYAFSSQVFLTGQLYVSKKERLEETDFAPEDQYYSLFHFRGNLNDNGIRTDKKTYGTGNVEKIGAPVLLFAGDLFGYSFDGASGFGAEQILLPRSKSALLPFTVKFRVLLSDSLEGRTWFETKSKDGAFAFSVFTNEEGSLAYKFVSSGRQAGGTAGGTLAKNVPLLAELSVVPKEGQLVTVWKLNGTASAAAQQNFVLDPIPELGTSRIGGEKGVVGILDEFGVIEDAVPAAPAPKSLYVLNESTAKTDYTLEGSVTVKDGFLVLAPGVEITALPVEFSEGIYSITLASDLLLQEAREGEIVLSLLPSDGSSAVKIAALKRSGAEVSLTLGEKQSVSAVTSRETFSFLVKKTSEKIEIGFLEETAALQPNGKPATLSILLRNPKQAASSFRIQKMEITKSPTSQDGGTVGGVVTR